MHRLFTDESLQVLIFVCVPLSLLLIAILIHARRGPDVARFSTFSVSISRISREEAYVTYHDKNCDIEFRAVLKESFSKQRQIHVQIPEKVPDEDVRKTIPNLVLGLEKLRFQYWIHKRDGTLIDKRD